MTTAPDLPLPVLPAQEPAVERPVLTVVPAQPTGPAIDFDEAVRAATPRLKRYAVRRLYDDHEAEEVVQEALLRAFQHRDQLTTEDDLMAWLTVVTGRLVIDRLRVRGRATPVAELPPGSRAERDTADVVVARDEARLALDALEAMPGRQAAVLWAREVEGLSYDAIGERFGMTEPTVRSVLHRARKTLRREYAARGGTFPAVGLVALAPWLHGLRAAGRLRGVVRRSAGAAAVTATGLAVATVVPFGAPGTTAPTTAPASRPAIVRTVAQHHVHHVAPTAHRQPAAVRAAGNPAPVAPADHRAAHSKATTVHAVPHVCGGSDYTVNCRTHRAPVLYVGPELPVTVAGAHRVGVSNTVADCTRLPATPVTTCDTSRGEPQ